MDNPKIFPEPREDSWEELRDMRPLSAEEYSYALDDLGEDAEAFEWSECIINCSTEA